jgi:nucleoid-associated protein YgaU
VGLRYGRIMRATRPAGLIGLLAFELLAVALLHRLGEGRWLSIPYDDVQQWLTTSAAEDVVMAGLRLVALACAYWLLLTTVLYLAALASRVPAAIRAVEWATLPAVRRLAHRAVAVVITTSTAVPGGAALAADRPVPSPPHGERAVVQLEAGTVASPPAATLPRPAMAATAHLVAAGENLWIIAQHQLAAAAGDGTSAPTDREVHAYWLRLLAHNHAALVSGDPDLIHPGERLVLPPVEGAIAVETEDGT